MAFYMNKLEFPSTKDSLCQVLVVLEKIFKILSIYFINFVIISLWHCPLYEQTWISFTQGCFVPVVLEKKIKMWKVYRRMDGQMNEQKTNGHTAIRKAHLSFQLRWAKKNSEKIILHQENFKKSVCKQESFKWPECFPLCEDTTISPIIIHARIIENRN